MSDQPQRPDVYEIKLDDDSGDDSRSAWEEALKELEGTKPVPKAPTPPPAASTNPLPAERPPRPAASTTPRRATNNRDATTQLNYAADLSAEDLTDEIVKKVTDAKKALADFVALHPYLIAPNIHRLWDDHFQETLVIMEREARRAKEKQEGQ